MIMKMYLRNIKKPLIFEVDHKDQLDKLYHLLMTQDIIKYGPVIFSRSEVVYIEIK